MTQVVGVVGDVRERLDVEPQPVMYQMPSQIPDGDITLINQLEAPAVLIRTRAGVPPMGISHLIEEALFLDHQLSVLKIRTMEQVGIDSTADKNFNLLLMTLFSVIAVVLAGVGIYGVMSYGVEQRTHEIGIRAAVGANRSDLLRLVLSQAVATAIVGIGVGVVASLGLMGLLRNQLFGVKASDPATFLSFPWSYSWSPLSRRTSRHCVLHAWILLWLCVVNKPNLNSDSGAACIVWVRRCRIHRQADSYY